MYIVALSQNVRGYCMHASISSSELLRIPKVDAQGIAGGLEKV